RWGYLVRVSATSAILTSLAPVPVSDENTPPVRCSGGACICISAPERTVDGAVPEPMCGKRVRAQSDSALYPRRAPSTLCYVRSAAARCAGTRRGTPDPPPLRPTRRPLYERGASGATVTPPAACRPQLRCALRRALARMLRCRRMRCQPSDESVGGHFDRWLP